MSAASIVLVVAHPGEETLSCARLLLRQPADCRVLHLADGITKDEKALRRSGAKSPADFVRIRHDELLAAMRIFGIEQDQLSSGGLAERELLPNLDRAIVSILSLMRLERPQEIHTHPFEGGNPDCDATCFAVHRAVEILAQNDEVRPTIFEFTGYHARDGMFRSAKFLSPYPMPQISILDENEREKKELALRCFRSQYDLYVRFSARAERWRRADSYDFGMRPHAGPLYYEMSRSGFTWDDFHSFVAALRKERGPAGGSTGGGEA